MISYDFIMNLHTGTWVWYVVVVNNDEGGIDIGCLNCATYNFAHESAEKILVEVILNGYMYYIFIWFVFGMTEFEAFFCQSIKSWKQMTCWMKYYNYK